MDHLPDDSPGSVLSHIPFSRRHGRRAVRHRTFLLTPLHKVKYGKLIDDLNRGEMLSVFTGRNLIIPAVSSLFGTVVGKGDVPDY